MNVRVKRHCVYSTCTIQNIIFAYTSSWYMYVCMQWAYLLITVGWEMFDLGIVHVYNYVHLIKKLNNSSLDCL